MSIKVEVTNLKRVLPACRRCRRRSDQMLRDALLPMLCDKCRGVISEEYPAMVPLEPVPLERARECLWNHDTDCGCWGEGVRFPVDRGMDLR